MRLLYVDPLGGEGGLGGYSDCLIRAYRDRGHQVTILTSVAAARAGFPPSWKTQTVYGAAFSRDRGQGRRALAYLVGCVRTLPRVLTHDALLHHLPHMAPIDAVTLWAARLAHCRVVLVAHDPRPLRHVPMERWYRSYFRQGDVVLVHGPAARSDLLEYGVESSRVRMVAHGDFLPRSVLSAAAAHASLGITAPLRRPIAAIVGNLKPGKGIRRVVAAASAANLGLGSLLVAGKPQNDNALTAFLQHPQPLPLELKTVFGRLTVEQELAAYSLADVVLALYDSGYSSGVVATAHALGKPVILTDVGDLARQAGPVDVVLSPDWTPAALAAAIGQVLESDETTPIFELGTSAMTPWQRHVDVVSEALER